MYREFNPGDVAVVQNVVKPWEDSTGNKVEIVKSADPDTDLSAAFAGGSPPDVFPVDGGRFGTYAKAGNLYAYGDKLDKGDFSAPLVQTFTRDGTFYCAPAGVVTLALVINPDLWSKAGLATTDIAVTAWLLAFFFHYRSGQGKGRWRRVFVPAGLDPSPTSLEMAGRPCSGRFGIPEADGSEHPHLLGSRWTQQAHEQHPRHLAAAAPDMQPAVRASLASSYSHQGAQHRNNFAS